MTGFVLEVSLSGFFRFPSQVCFPLTFVSHPCQRSQGHSDSQFLNLASLNSLCSKIISSPPAQTRILGDITLLFCFWEFEDFYSDLLSIFALRGVLDAEVLVFRPLYPTSWGVRTGLVSRVPVPEMGDVVFLHLSSLDQKKSWNKIKQNVLWGQSSALFSK